MHHSEPTPPTSRVLSGFDIFYGALLLFLSPLLVPLLLFRRSMRQDFLARIAPSAQRRSRQRPVPTADLWIHAASIGETRIAVRLIEAWSHEQPDTRFVLTTNTLRSLRQVPHLPSLEIALAPFDFSPVVDRFVAIFQPRHLILVETEIWPNTIRIMSQRGRVTIINGRLSERYFGFYCRFRFLLHHTLPQITRVLARDTESARRFETLGMDVDRIELPGNLKFEQPVPPPAVSVQDFRQAYGITSSQYCFVAGSIQPEETAVIVEAWQAARQQIADLRLFIIPRHPDKRTRFEIVLTRLDVGYHLATATSDRIRQSENDRVQVIDQIGVLKSWYAIADVVFVGGSLCRRGGQNMLEAVGLGKPVCIGPWATNFKEEVALLQSAKAIRIIENATTLTDFILDCRQNPAAAAAMGVRGQAAICRQVDNLQRTLHRLIDIYGTADQEGRSDPHSTAANASELR
jgi:3-deoxy-D-manno-octulosonic-acid transferase